MIIVLTVVILTATVIILIVAIVILIISMGMIIMNTNEQYWEGQGDLVSRLITPITHIITLVIPITNQLTKSP